jgi:hypothetical protein
MRRAEALAGALLGATLGCAPAPPRPDVVARLAGEVILYPAFEAYVGDNVPAAGTRADSEVLSRLLDRFLEEELLARLAGAERGSPVDRRVAIDALVAQRAGVVADTEVAAYYEAHREEMAQGPRLDLQQLLLDDRALADEAIRRLTHGEPFDRVAQTLVPGGEGVEAWRQRDVELAELPPAFADAVRGLAVGGVSPALPADAGWVVLVVARRRAAEQVALESAAPAIRARLAVERAAAARHTLVEAASDRYDLEVFERNLPFAYRGRFRTPE